MLLKSSIIRGLIRLFRRTMAGISLKQSFRGITFRDLNKSCIEESDSAVCDKMILQRR